MNSVTYINLSQYAHLHTLFFARNNILKLDRLILHSFSSETTETQFMSLILLMEE